MDKETRDMFNAVLAAIDRSEERINKRFDALENEWISLQRKKSYGICIKIFKKSKAERAVSCLQ